MMHGRRLYNFCTHRNYFRTGGTSVTNVQNTGIAGGLSCSLDSVFFEHALSCHRLLVADVVGVSWVRDIFI